MFTERQDKAYSKISLESRLMTTMSFRGYGTCAFGESYRQKMKARL